MQSAHTKNMGFENHAAYMPQCTRFALMILRMQNALCTSSDMVLDAGDL